MSIPNIFLHAIDTWRQRRPCFPPWSWLSAWRVTAPACASPAQPLVLSIHLAKPAHVYRFQGWGESTREHLTVKLIKTGWFSLQSQHVGGGDRSTRTWGPTALCSEVLFNEERPEWGETRREGERRRKGGMEGGDVGKSQVRFLIYSATFLSFSSYCLVTGSAHSRPAIDIPFLL